VQAVIVHDRSASASASGGFVNLRRLDLAVCLPGEPLSRPFAFDIATRRAIDAVVVVAHFAREGRRHVYLRSCPRPSLMLHDGPEGAREGNLWEVVAGLVEPGEAPEAAATRELHEELGFEVAASAMARLGGYVYPAPGFVAEQQHYFHAEVDPDARQAPLEDGSPLEAGARIISLPLDDALSHCREGHLVDAKTELALRRLAEACP
jgi:ADP-ribose pyrophosphatase